MARKKVYRK